MIYEYALEPEMVATWGTLHNSRFFIREFGMGQGRIVSRYPKKWAKKVWEAFVEGSDNHNDRRRMVELLVRLQETMIVREGCCWDDSNGNWLKNALLEHTRYPFKAILAKNNPENRPEILAEDALSVSPCPGWDNPHGITVKRKAHDMAAAVRRMLTCCRWVKFIDPYFSQCKHGHKQSIIAFLNILKNERPLELSRTVEIHASGDGATIDYLKDFFEKIIPVGTQVTIYQWQERLGGQRLHNRYILTDLGGVSFSHGLDAGGDGETDDINRLDHEQYIYRCKEYDPAAPAFDEASKPLTITGR